MKKTIGILSLAVLLFSTFAPTFTYATEAEDEAKQILTETLDETMNEFEEIDNLTMSSDSISLMSNPIYTSGCYKYSYNDDGTIKINELIYQCTTELDPVIIPSQIDGKDVTVLGAQSFRAKSVKSAIIPDTVKIIEYKAFAGVRGGTTIGSSVEYIGESAFEYNTFTNLTLPESVNYIGERAFLNATIDNLVLPSVMEYVGPQAFRGSIGYSSDFITYTGTDGSRILVQYNGTNKNVEIPDGINGIQKFAFLYKNIESVTIPDSVTHITGGAFAGNSIKTGQVFFFEGGNSDHENLVSYGGTEQNIIIPEGVKIIKEDAFYERGRLFYIPESVETIEYNAFGYYGSVGVRPGGNQGLENNDSNRIEIVDSETHSCFLVDNNGTLKKYLGIIPKCGKFVNIPEEVDGITINTIGNQAFYYLGITGVIIPDTVTKIEYNAFYGNKLPFVNLPNSVTEIGSYAFSSSSFPIYGYRINGTNGLNNQDSYLRIVEPGDGCFGFNKDSGVITNYYIGRNENCSTDMILPSEIDGVKVLMVVPDANIGRLTSLTIEENDHPIQIGYNAFYGNEDLEEVTINGTITGLPNNNSNLFSYYSEMKNIKKITINSGVETLSEYLLRGLKAKELVLSEGLKTIGNYTFYENNLDKILLPNSVESIGNYAFCKDYNKVEKVDAIVLKDITDTTMYDEACLNLIRGYNITFKNGETNLKKVIYVNGESIEIPSIETKVGYEFIGWGEEGNNNIIDFTNDIIDGDKILIPVWKSLEEKSDETTTENVVYTNNTTVTVGDETTEEVLSGSSTLKLVTEEVKEQEVAKEEDKITVKESEIKVTSDKKVEYEGGLEVYIEKTENVGMANETTGKVEGTIKFSAPIAVKIPVSSDAEYVKVQVKHGDEEFGFKGLTLKPVNECNNGEAVNDKYNGEDVEVKENNGERYATIYTCSASTFIAYTESAKPIIAQPSAGGGRTITTTKQESIATEQEHNSADIEDGKNSETKENNIKTVKDFSNKSLTRGEVAVMTDILLEVFPQLTEDRELQDVTKACSSYIDEQNFTKDEKKAITRLCRLSIMGIHDEDNKPLDEFMVKQMAKNNEFATVMNRVVENYNEKDLSSIKDALKKLESNEENVVFGTLYEMFMNVKGLLNK